MGATLISGNMLFQRKRAVTKKTLLLSTNTNWILPLREEQSHVKECLLFPTLGDIPGNNR